MDKMKLLRVKANHFKNCSDEFEIDFVARSKKTSEDKEYELQEIADELYVHNTIAANYAQTECQFRYCGTAIPFLTVRSTAR